MGSQYLTLLCWSRGWWHPAANDVVIICCHPLCLASHSSAVSCSPGSVLPLRRTSLSSHFPAVSVDTFCVFSLSWRFSLSVTDSMQWTCDTRQTFRLICRKIWRHCNEFCRHYKILKTHVRWRVITWFLSNQLANMGVAQTCFNYWSNLHDAYLIIIYCVSLWMQVLIFWGLMSCISEMFTCMYL